MKKYRNQIAFKTFLSSLLLLVSFAVVLGTLAYHSFSSVVLKEYTDGGFRIANAASTVVDADMLDEWMENGGSDEAYQTTWNRLDRICNATYATFVYVIRPDLNDFGHITFVFSTVRHDSEYTPYELGYVRPTTNQEYREKYQALWYGQSERESLVLNSRQYASATRHITVMLPLVGSDGETKGILCVQRQMDELTAQQHAYIRTVVVITCLLTALVLALQRINQSRTLLLPIQKITQESCRFAEENVLTGTKLSEEIRNRDEIGQLAASIDRMEEQIVENVEELKTITAERERANTELSLAARIQSAMLPGVFPAFPERKDFDIYAEMDPAREVGGDFYDFFLIDDDHLCIEIADVSGKGVPASLFMMSSKIILASHAMLGLSPAEVLREANHVICANNTVEMFVTVWLGILELSTGRLTAANAGHEYPVLKAPDGRFELLKDRHGFVLGGMDNMQFRNYELMLEPGSKLFVYTDGVPEATDPEDAFFGTERMLDALNEDPEAAPEQVLKNVRAAVDRFVKDAEQFDDLTMLCLEYRGPEPPKAE